MMRTDPELFLGDLRLHPPSRSDASEWEIQTSDDGTDWGNPEAVVEIVNSLLRDGSLARLTRWDNRTAVVHVRVLADSYDGLAAGEAALMAQVNVGRNTLTWVPPRVDAVATVFDVLVSKLEFEFDGFMENSLIRTYTLTLTCLPFARSASPTTVAGVASGATVTPTDIDTIDDNTDARWAMVAGTTFSVTSGRAEASSRTSLPYPSTTLVTYAKLRRTSATSMSGSPFLVVDVSNGIAPSTFAIDDVPVAPVLTYMLVGALTRHFLPAPASFTRLEVAQSYSRPYSAGTTPFALSVYNVARASAARIPGTGRQQLFTVPVLGSARTQASLEVYDASSAALGPDASGVVGNVVVYTRAAGGLAPNLSAWITSSESPTGDSARISGAIRQVRTGVGAGATVYRIPAVLLEEALYGLMVAARSTTAPSWMSWTAQLVKAGTTTPVGPAQSGAHYTALTSSWDVHDIGRILLPPTRVLPGSTHELLLTIEAEGGGSGGVGVYLDEAWLFNLDAGDVSQVRPGAGVAALRINAADAANPRQEFQVADAAASWATTGRNADNLVRSWGVHEWEPGNVDVFVACTGSTSAQVDLSYPPRWHTHARF